ncbi:hypothetical protein [Streptomyces sp. NPDC058394]|uniref:hypothetical protein n=1 Tax=unclassified Streptomyces TaxID=2593676 RepID=UPI00364DD6F4
MHRKQVVAASSTRPVPRQVAGGVVGRSTYGGAPVGRRLRAAAGAQAHRQRGRRDQGGGTREHRGSGEARARQRNVGGHQGESNRPCRG